MYSLGTSDCMFLQGNKNRNSKRPWAKRLFLPFHWGWVRPFMGGWVIKVAEGSRDHISWTIPTVSICFVHQSSGILSLGMNFAGGPSTSLGSPAAQKSRQVEVHRGLLGLAPCSNMILTLKKMLKSRKSSCWNTTSYIDAIHQYLLKVFLYSLHFLYPE